MRDLVIWLVHLFSIALVWLSFASILSLFVSALILVPMALIRGMRFFAGWGFVLVSFVFGANALLLSALQASDSWGIGGLIFGALFFGIGVVPVGLAGAAWNGRWGMCALIIALTALAWGLRLFGVWLGDAPIRGRVASPRAGQGAAAQPPEANGRIQQETPEGGLSPEPPAAKRQPEPLSDEQKRQAYCQAILWAAQDLREKARRRAPPSAP